MLKVENLSGGYTRKKNVLRDISFSLERGELVCVVGKNASGKSTLLRMMLGLTERSCGEVTVDDVSINDMSRRDIARKLAYLTQGTDVPDMTVGELVLHGRFAHTAAMSPYSERDRAIADECIERMGLSELTDTHLAELSGGTRQKAYLAMVLCQQTEYILLDEPTTYLDISHQIDLMRQLRALADEGRGVLCVMHDIPLALEYSDKVAVIEDGTLVAFDTPRQICDSGILHSALGVVVKYDGERYVYQFNRNDIPKVKCSR